MADFQLDDAKLANGIVTLSRVYVQTRVWPS